MMNKAFFVRNGSRSLGLLALIPHIFTCILPTVAAFLSASGLLGATRWFMNLPGMGVVDAYSYELLWVATVASVIGVGSHVWRWACGCGPVCACGLDCTCAKQGWVGWLSFGFSLLMLALVAFTWWCMPRMDMDAMEAGDYHTHMMMMDHMPMPEGGGAATAPAPSMGHHGMEDAD